MKKIDAVSYTADPCLHTFYKRTPKYLFIILFLVAVIFGCTFYQRVVGQVEFGNYVKHPIFNVAKKVRLSDNQHNICIYFVGGWFKNNGLIEYPCGEHPKWEQFNEKQKAIVKDGVIREIKEQALEHNVNPVKALDIAFCESSYNPFATSKKSSAKGVYQFIDKTWSKYCNGDPLNQTDNIKCFMQIYPENKSWWVCKG